MILVAMLVMGLLELTLFWAPVAGPIIAGLVGGWVAGSAGTAMIAAILPAILLGVLLFLGYTYFRLPVLRGFLGLGLTVYLIATRVLLVVAAATGGLLAGRGR